jgi:hypothetical protein
MRSRRRVNIWPFLRFECSKPGRFAVVRQRTVVFRLPQYKLDRRVSTLGPTLNKTFFLLGAALFGLLGVAHAVLTLRDLQVPRSFTPTDENIRRAMAEAPLRLAPRTTIWNAWLGFNLSHSLGLLIFGSFFGTLALHDFGTVAEHLFVRVSAVVVGLIYLVLALRFWFWVPAVLSAAGTLCFVVSALSN